MARDTALLLLELTALFFSVTFLVQLLQRWLGPERLRAWMGGRPVVAALKGIAIGFVTPFCTFTAIPLLLGLRQAGVTPAGYVAFIVAAPVLDPVLFGALIVIVGIKAALMYAVVAFCAALSLALFAEAVDLNSRLKPMAESEVVPADDPGGGSCGPEGSAWRGLRLEVPAAGRAAVALLRSMAPLLLVGIGIGLAIEVLISPETAARVTGNSSVFAVPVAAALGTPLYFSTELFIPIADSLSAAGVGVGAIVALTIAGAGANIPEFILLSRMATKRVIGVFVGYVFLVAAGGGWLAEFVTV